ncbi:MAG: putative Rossmann fold flavoprotein [Parasphingorhabdus sp.]|jgi:predicted Rossmann fold flavoprotein
MPTAPTSSSIHYDVIILGGGAAGLMCALTAGQRGRRVLLLEASNKLGKKILMSGGGRCNFTNLEVLAEHFVCANPHFVKSALSQYSQWDFISLVAQYEVAYHDKGQGQLFCDKSAKDILNILTRECSKAGVEMLLSCSTEDVATKPGSKGFRVKSGAGDFSCQSLVVATGGLSIPTLGGATGYGYQLARQFDIEVSKTEASLVPMTLTGKWLDLANSLSGVAVSVNVSVPGKGFTESMLFTHRGLSGPAILQLSNYWHLGESICIDLLPGESFLDDLLSLKETQPKATILSALNTYLPKSVAKFLITLWWPEYTDTSLQEIKNTVIREIANQVHQWKLNPSGTEGYRTAEVTRGGVDVDSISSKSMQVKSLPGLFMVGEVLDVTGHLGGYNFQWAWSSGYVAGINA